MPEQSSKTDRWRTEIEKWAQTNKSLQNSPALRQALEDLAHAHLRGAPSTRGAGELTSGERMVQWIGDRLPVLQNLVARPADTYHISMEPSGRIKSRRVEPAALAKLAQLMGRHAPYDLVFDFDLEWDAFWRDK